MQMRMGDFPSSSRSSSIFLYLTGLGPRVWRHLTGLARRMSCIVDGREKIPLRFQGRHKCSSPIMFLPIHRCSFRSTFCGAVRLTACIKVEEISLCTTLCPFVLPTGLKMRLLVDGTTRPRVKTATQDFLFGRRPRISADTIVKCGEAPPIKRV